MDPLQVSAQFAAFVWFSHGKPDTEETREEANRYAKTNWTKFLPLAHQGLGQLLLKIMSPPRRMNANEAKELAMAS